MDVTMQVPDAAAKEIEEEVEALALVRRGNRRAFEFIVRRYNQRLYRICRGILGSDADAQDALQDAYVQAFTHLEQLADNTQLGGWLARIAKNGALQRLRSRREVAVGYLRDDDTAWEGEHGMSANEIDARPAEEAIAAAEFRTLLEEGIDTLPEEFRVTFVLRVVGEMRVAEVAALLDIAPETVKTRTHRARRLLQRALRDRLEQALPGVFPFGGERCDRIVRHVLVRLGLGAQQECRPRPH